MIFSVILNEVKNLLKNIWRFERELLPLQSLREK